METNNSIWLWGFVCVPHKPNNKRWWYLMKSCLRCMTHNLKAFNEPDDIFCKECTKKLLGEINK